MVELAERLGPSLVWWLDQPAALGLWSYYHLQQLDRRREFSARLDRIESGLLTNFATCAPERLQQYENDVFAGAARRDPEAERALAIERVRAITDGKVLADG